MKIKYSAKNKRLYIVISFLILVIASLAYSVLLRQDLIGLYKNDSDMGAVFDYRQIFNVAFLISISFLVFMLYTIYLIKKSELEYNFAKLVGGLIFSFYGNILVNFTIYNLLVLNVEELRYDLNIIESLTLTAVTWSMLSSALTYKLISGRINKTLKLSKGKYQGLLIIAIYIPLLAFLPIGSKYLNYKILLFTLNTLVAFLFGYILNSNALKMLREKNE